MTNKTRVSRGPYHCLIFSYLAMWEFKRGKCINCHKTPFKIVSHTMWHEIIMLAKHSKLLSTDPHALHTLKLQHFRMSQVIATLIMLTLVAMVTTSVDEVCASSKYEEMGPLAVHSFQTSRPDWTYAIVCNSFTIISGSSASNGYHPPPAHLFVVAPSVGGHYPVLLFKHGTFLANCAYSQLLLHIASYGYIVVAPQVYLCIIQQMPTQMV